jgi:hypothetical protein
MPAGLVHEYVVVDVGANLTMHSVPLLVTVTDALESTVCVQRPIASALAVTVAACEGIAKKAEIKSEIAPITAFFFIAITSELLNFDG